MIKRLVLSLAVAALALVLSSTVALALTINGTNRADQLVGKGGADKINGKGGNDRISGKGGNDRLIGGPGRDSIDGGSGNDTYIYQNGWGKDRPLVDPVGTDTVNFSGVTAAMDVSLLPEFGEDANFAASYNKNFTLYTNTVPIKAGSRIENAIGGSGPEDHLYGGEAANSYQPGKGDDDQMWDYGGWRGRFGAGDPTLYDLAASNDTYKGFSRDSGFDYVVDYGGNTDKVDLRLFKSGAVAMSREDADENGSQESLTIVLGPSSGVLIYDYFGMVQNELTQAEIDNCSNGTTETTTNGCTLRQSGTIEQLVFANKVLSPDQVITLTTSPPEGGTESTTFGVSTVTSDGNTASTEKLLSNAPDFDGAPRFLKTLRR